MQLEMENEDVMECVQEQLGGGSTVAKDEPVNYMELLTSADVGNNPVGTPQPPRRIGKL